MEAPQGQQEKSGQQFNIAEIETGIDADQDQEAATSEPIKPFAECQSGVNAVAISPKGRTRIAVGLADGTVQIWDVLTETKWVSCQGHTDSVISVSFSPDGSMIVSGSGDNTLRLWDAKTGEAIGQPLSGHTGAVNSVAFNPDGNTVASGSRDKTVRLWDVNTGKAIGQLFSHAQPVTSVAFSPDGNTIVSGSWDNTVWLWDLNTEQAIAQPFSGHTKPILSVAFSPDGNTIVSGSWDKTVRLWNVETGEAIAQFSGHADSVKSVAFSPDGNTIVSGSFDNSVLLWDVKTGKAIGQPFSGHAQPVTSVTFSPDGSMVVSGSDDKTLWLWDVETGIPINQGFSGHRDTVNSVAFSPDGSTVVSGGEDNRVLFWDIKTGKALGQSFSSNTDRHRDIVKSVAFSPDGKTVVSGSNDTTIRLWDVEKRKTIDKPFFGHVDTVTSVAFSPDGSIVVSGSEDITVRLWDAKTGEAIGQPFSGHTNSVTSVAFSPDGNTVVSGSWDRTVRLWNVKTGKAIGQPFFGHTDSVISVAFSADGNSIVSSSLDKTVRVWDVETGKAIGQPFFGHKYLVNSVAFSPDGSSIISGSADKTVQLWDISDPQRKRKRIIEHQGEVHSVAFDPLGDYIISAGEYGIKVWKWEGFNIRRFPQAFSNDQANGEDSLDVSKELQSLADVLMLRSLKPPLAVAILGSWGSGKSFGMHLIEKQITKIRCQKLTQEQTWSEQGDEPNLSAYVGHVYQIKFNAWSYAKSDLWASLMQTIFEQLDRQLSLERQLREVGENDLAGGNVWGVINQMNDSDRRAILKSELSQEVFAELKAKNLDSQTLWGILSEVRQEEQKKLESTENELQKLELDVKIKNQEIDKIEQEFNQEVKNIEATVEKEMSDRATLIVFLSQLKEILKEDFGDSILKDFLESCEIKNQKDVKDNLKFDLHKLSDPQITNIIDTAITLLKSAKTLDLDLDQLLSSDFVKNQTDETIKKAITLLEYIQNFKPTLFKNREKITNFLEEQPSKIVGFIEFIKKNPKKLILFFSLVSLPFIVYFSLVPLVKLWGEISTVLQLWLTSVSSIPAITIGMEIFKRIQTLLVRTRKLFQVGRKKIKQEKENIAKIKDQLVKEKIETIAKGHEETQKKDNQEEINNENITNENSDDDNYPQEVEKFKNKIEEIYANREKAKKELTKQQEQIEKLKAQVERQKQRIGLTAQYPSLLDFVNNRLEDDSYQKRLGLMNQVQNDLKDLSDHLTYIPKHTNPDKLKVLKEYFPRGPARIVLYIDDLDRCPPDRVVQVLEAVQLLLNTDIFVVVLAIDDRYISRALEQTYRGVLKRGGTPSGVDYIEKIIQIPYRMRPISKEVAESYLQSLVDIDEETKQENQNISNSKPVIQKSIVLEQTIEQDESKFLLEDGSKLLLEDEQVSEISYQDNIEEYPVETEEKIPEDDISESTNKKSNSESNNKKIPNSANSDPLVDVQRFTAEEFRWIKECCQHVDLTPRTAKRLINICKIIRIIWTPTENDTTWKEPPTAECKQTLIAFLALAGRYPKEMRKILAEIYLEFEETDENTVTIYKNEWLENLDHQDAFIDMHTQREWKKFKNDFYKMPPETEFVFEKRTFNLAVSFCFVGDIGYDPDDNQNREYR